MNTVNTAVNQVLIFLVFAAIGYMIPELIARIYKRYRK